MSKYLCKFSVEPYKRGNESELMRSSVCIETNTLRCLSKLGNISIKLKDHHKNKIFSCNLQMLTSSTK